MARIHLFEFEDLPWFPKLIRNYMTDFLQFVANQFDFYKEIVPVLKEGVDASDHSLIIDLASGGGGGWKKLHVHLKSEMPGVKVLLTDYYPNIPAFEKLQKMAPEVLSFERNQVNALDVPTHLKGMRTQFLSLHHFRPEQVRTIFQNAVNAGQPIACFEAQQRSVGDFIKFFFSPINVLLVTPFIKPFSLGRILLTYIIPLVPLFVWWDGLVSVLRTYSKNELETIINQLEDNDFNWKIDSVKNKGVSIYYVLGTPT